MSGGAGPDRDGLLAERRAYRPFGQTVYEQRWSVTLREESKGFIGERYDADAGLQYLNARYYDPELGLFLQPDWFEVTDPGVGPNRYAYAHNDPINKLELNEVPEDWPDALTPGSLNLRVTEFPAEFGALKLEPSAKSLDVAEFAPAFTTAQDAMGNNRLRPNSEMPHKGTAQVWRAVLNVESKQTSCWVLRRFGSGLWNQIEMVSELHLRTALGLTIEHDWPASLTMFGAWGTR